MNIRFFCPLWGMESMPFEEFCHKVASQGYDGVETRLPQIFSQRKKMTDALKKNGLALIAQHSETSDSNFVDHKRHFLLRLENLAEAEPEFINSQTGLDWFSPEKNLELIDAAESLAEIRGVKLLHETHRGKFSFAAHITGEFLSRRPDLRMTLDISHWLVTAASDLSDQGETVDLAIDRTDHIHARVGFPEGPQVGNPFQDYWKTLLERHLAWWDRIVERKRNAGKDLTITLEAGPTPYMPVISARGIPVADQWDINARMHDFLRERYRCFF